MQALVDPRIHFMRSERLLFRCWRDTTQDFLLAKELWADKQVTKFIGGPFSDEEVYKRLQDEIDCRPAVRFLDGHSKESCSARTLLQYWPVFSKVESRQSMDDTLEHQGTTSFIGCCGLRPYFGHRNQELERYGIPADCLVYEIGVHLLPSQWGKGFASEALERVKHFALTQLEEPPYALFAGHHPQNVASQRLLTKLSFRYSHDELYPATGLSHPSYFCIRDS